jgi:DNA repair exonuclease SbcCD ATPase subunit
MINIERVRFKNFLSFGSRIQEIDFTTGVNIVLGLDKDKDKSNGAGKSSFLETIPFALFGQTHKPVKKEDIINWKNRKACLVELYFSKGEYRYLVRRGIKPNIFDIYENDVLIDKPSHIRDYQSILEDIIGLNFQTFMSLIHSNINSSMPVLAMKKPEKRKFIEKVFGLEIYSWLNEQANEKLRTVNDKIRESQIRIESNNSRSSEIVSKIASLEAKLRQTSSTELELREQSERLEKLLEDFDEDERSNLRDSISSKESQKAQMQVLIDRIKNKNINYVSFKLLTPVEFAINGLEEQIKENEKLKVDRDTLKQYYGKHGDIKKLENIKKKENDKLNELGKELRDIQDKKNEILSYIGLNSNNLSRNTKTLESLKKDSICPTCGQKIKDIPVEHIESLEKENEILLNSISESRKKIDELKDSEIDLKNEIENLSSIVKTLDEDWRHMWNLENRIAHAPEVDPNHIIFYKNKRDKYNRVIEKLKEQINKFERQIKQLVTDVNLLTERKNYLDTKYKEIQELEGIVDRLEEKIELERQNKIEFQQMLEEEKNISKSLRSQNEEQKKKIEFNSNLIDYFDAMKWVCKDENIKRFAISYMMPYLNSRVNHYLSEVGYGFYASIDNWLDVTIKGPGIPNGSYGSLSGGEARGIDLALQFAIHDVARLRSGVWPDLIVMDEILDSSIDSQGIEKLMEIISVRQSEEGNKIFIISHREEIGESFDADNVYFVTKEDGYSKVNMK